MNKSVLVVGGGFIGANLANHLNKMGWNVTCFDIKRPCILASEIACLERDFFQLGSFEDAVPNFDVVIHALGVLNPGNSSDKFEFGYSRELIRSIELFNCATKNDVRVVYISSGGTVYAPSDRPIKESHALYPANHYGAMKIGAEASLLAFASDRSVPCVSVRLANPFGPGQDFRRGVGFISAVVQRSLDGLPICLYGNGGIIRDYIYIDDAVSMIAELAVGICRHTVYNVGTGVGIDQLGVIRAVNDLGLITDLQFLPPRDVDLPYVVLDSERAILETGVKPRSICEGLYCYLNWAQVQI